MAARSDQFADACPGTSKYLHVTYQCVTGATVYIMHRPTGLLAACRPNR